MSDVPTIALREVCRRITKGTTPTTLGFSFAETGVNFVKSEAITRDGRIDPSKFAFIDAATHEALSRSILEEDDVLFSMAGVHLAKTAVVPKSILPANTNQAVGIIRLDRTKAVPRFIHYVLSSPICRDLVLRSVAQSAQPNVNLSDIGKLQIPKIPISEQRLVSNILGQLDDKIELNRKTNEALEAIARAIFKSWFVNFDPVRARAEGHQPIGMEAATAAFFPDSFEDSELGEIPKGWMASCLGAIISRRTDRIRSRAAVVLSAVADSELVRSDEHFTKRVHSKEIDKYLGVEQWDFAYNPSRINIGSIGMSKKPSLSAVSPVYVVFRPRPGYRWFLEFYLSQTRTRQWIKTLATGSVRQSLSYSDLESIPCVVPPEPLIRKFDDLWSSFQELVISESNESRTLASLRDMLLPKLMSGEIRVQSAKHRMEDRL